LIRCCYIKLNKYICQTETQKTENMTTETTKKAVIQFGNGDDAVTHVIEWSNLNNYLDSLKNAGWDLNECQLIKTIN
jgi:hypothetical protein